MQKLLVAFLFFLSISSSAEASGSKNKTLTFNQIAIKCTGRQSKWVEYNNIGFPQSAKNYLRVCIDNEVEKVRQAKLTKCLEKSTKNMCLATFKLD